MTSRRGTTLGGNGATLSSHHHGREAAASAAAVACVAQWENWIKFVHKKVFVWLVWTPSEKDKIFESKNTEDRIQNSVS